MTFKHHNKRYGSLSFMLWRQAHFRAYMAMIFITFLPLIIFPQAAEKNTVGVNDTATLRRSITHFFEQQAAVRYIYQVAINPAATDVVWSADGPQGSPGIYRSLLSHTDSNMRVTATLAVSEWCNETEPQWSPDGHEIAFLSDARSHGQVQVFIANAFTGALIKVAPLTKFNGYVSHLKWSPDGKYLSVLYVEKASREPSPMAAENKAVGLIDSAVNRDVQRIAVVDRLRGVTREVTPLGLYIFDYDWSPDSKKFVYTASVPPGDDNWYIAQLYQQSVYEPHSLLLYKPLRQIALPRWSPDGKRIAFIEGLMSDQGGTGGEIFVMPATPRANVQNLTPTRKSTPSWFTWRPDGNIVFTEFVGGSVAINMLYTSTGVTTRLWQADESIRAGSEEMSVSVGSNTSTPVVAFIRSSWDKLPEIYSGSLNRLIQVTHLNTLMRQSMPKASNVQWINEGLHVQGWLLSPDNYNSKESYPMLVCVHGGPAWITTPTWSAPDFNTTVYTRSGYFVFFPNPRGSYGQGETFTLADRRDWGFGDLRDILSGVDTVIKKFPIDTNRIGILGWSYGGSMSMFAITQTTRFRAAVAGAGAGDWLSYYGQNAIDKWMWSYFDASPYDDPAAYVKCSAMTYIKQAKTPALVLVGELDGEAPAPQSFQFWHALKELKVPTQLMVYAGEGHSFEKFENMIDVSIRTIEWFNKYMPP